MHLPFHSPFSPLAATITSLCRDRRVVVGASIGGSFLLVLVWALAGRTEDSPTPAAGTATSSTVAAPGADQLGRRAAAAVETYPIPSEAIANNVAQAPASAKTTASRASITQDRETARPAIVEAKSARYRGGLRRGVSPARGDGRGFSARAPAAPPLRLSTQSAASLPLPASPSFAGGDTDDVVLRSAETANPAPELKKRVRLVDDSARVRILE
jgi:hypothetical protein